MTLPRAPAVSVFWQTLFLLVVFLLIVNTVTNATLLATLQSSPSFIGMNQIADRLAGNPSHEPPGSRSPAAAARVAMASEPPILPRGMLQDRALSFELARALELAPEKVRLFYAPDQRRFSPFAHPGRSEPVPHVGGEALFFDEVIAAAEVDGRWRVLSMPRSPRVAEWARRQRINQITIVLLLVATAFLFAQQLARPMRRFAASADRVGRDTSAPPVPVRGPKELRIAALAINAMQRRIEDILRERTEMVAAIAHDLRTPLARIAFRVENSGEAIREPVLDDIEQMREMIAATLDFSRVSMDLRPQDVCDLNVVIEEVARSAREVGQDVSAMASGPLPVCGDPLALKRMLQNLVENAAHYADGAVISAAQDNGIISIEVSDRGPGLPEEMLQRVLAPFVRNEPSRSRETGGVGLGLAISKSIAAKHGGNLVLINRRGGGLTAQITLPAPSTAT